MRHALLASILLIASLGALRVEAQNGTNWTTETVPTNGATPTGIILATAGERLGLTFHSAGTVYFVLRDLTTGWSIKTTNALGATDLETGLVWMGGTTWGMSSMTTSGSANGAAKFYRSTDDGATWTVAATGKDWQNSISFAWTGGTSIAVAFLGFGSYAAFQSSTDAGTTWSTPRNVNTNSGSGNSCGSNLSLIMESVSLRASAGRYDIALRENNAPWRVFNITSSDGYFWTTIYGTNCGTAPSPAATKCEGATATAPPNNARTLLTSSALGYGWTTAGKQYWCIAHRNAGKDATAIPSPTPTNTLAASAAAMDSNPAGQLLVSLLDSTAATLTTYYRGPSGAATAADTLTSFTSLNYAVKLTPTRGYLVFIDPLNGQTKAKYASVFVPNATPSFATAAGFTGLNSIDVDPTGQTVIGRLSGGLIKTWPAQTLGAATATTTSSCNMSDGIAVGQIGTVITYADCDEDAKVNSLKVLTPSFGTPGFPNLCRNTVIISSDYYCHTDATSGFQVDVPERLNNIGRIEAIPFDFTFNQYNGAVLGLRHTALSWAYSTTDGRLGIFAVDQHENLVGRLDLFDQYIDDTIAVGTRPFNDLCSWTSHEGTMGAAGTSYYIVGVASDALPTVITVQFTPQNSETAFDVDKMGSYVKLYPWFNLPSYAGAQSVGCAEDRLFLVTSTGHMGMFSVNAPNKGKQLWSEDIPDAGCAKCASMSYDGRFVVWVANNTVTVAHADNGTVTGTFQIAAGDVLRVLTDLHAQDAWIGYSDHIDRYHIVPFTTKTEQTNDLANFTNTNPAHGTNNGPGSSGSSSSGGNGNGPQFIWFSISTVVGAFAAWFITGGKIQDGKVAPGNPIIIGMAAYLGMWVGVIMFAGDYWWIPTLLPVGGLAVYMFSPKGRGL